MLYIGSCLILTSCTPLPNCTIPCTPSGPVVFCDVVGTEEDEESKEEVKNSKKNEKEADKTVSVNNDFMLLLTSTSCFMLTYISVLDTLLERFILVFSLVWHAS